MEGEQAGGGARTLNVDQLLLFPDTGVQDRDPGFRVCRWMGFMGF